ncbi:hypothetical protein [Anditalea andensis]|uniref:Uncharacterized protein n=1 Tax=Anditalea andensis TaxID=1048983 RepID=A0A074LMS6_9BACT|nr:hypothetical protein [Anditalea andensis]KEO75187.1 hypothetical protein EL17_05830 [Anditalea andensis]
MQVLIVVILLILGWILSEVQNRHLTKPFLSRRGFAFVSFASFFFFMFGAFVSLRVLFEKLF